MTTSHFDAGMNRMIEPQEIGAILKDALVRNMSHQGIADLHGTTRKAVYDIIWKHRNISSHTKEDSKMTLITGAMSEGIYYSLSHSNKTQFHVSIDENDGRDDFTLNFDSLELALRHLKENYGEGIYQEFIENLID